MTMQPWWRPDRFAARRGQLEARGRILRAVRDFFAERGLCRGRHAGVAGEPRARAASPGLRDRAARSARRRPRAALSAHLARIRDEEAAGRRHAADLAARACLPQRRARRDAPPRIRDARMVSGRRLVPRPDGRLRGAAARRPAGGGRRGAALARADAPMPALPWQRLTVAEAFRRHMPASTCWRRRPIRGARTPPCSPPRRARIGIAPHPGDDWETLFFRIFLERIEPHLGIGAPTILYDYPVSMAALSRRKPDDPRLAERFELYVCGLELANAFGELTDAGRAARAASSPTRRASRRSTARPTRSTRISSRRSNTACRTAPGSRSASTGWSCWRPGPTDIEEVLWAPVT